MCLKIRTADSSRGRRNSPKERSKPPTRWYCWDHSYSRKCMVSSSLEMSFQKKTSPGWGSGGKRRFHDSEPRGDGPALHPYSWSCCRGLKWVEMHIFTLNKTKPNHQHGHFWAAWLLSQPEVLSWETEHVLVEGEPSCPIRPGEPVVTGGIGQPSPPDQQTDRPEGPRCVQEATAAAGPRLRVLTVKACSLDVAVAPVCSSLVFIQALPLLGFQLL